MSDTFEIELCLPLKAGYPNDLAEQIGDFLGPCPEMDGRGIGVAALSAELEISYPEIQITEVPIAIIDGALHISATCQNISRPHLIWGEGDDHVESDYSRLRHMFDLLSLHHDLPSGSIIGAIRSDWDYNLADPIIVTSTDIAALCSGAQQFADAIYYSGERHKLRVIPAEIADQLEPNSIGWADYSETQLAQIKAHAISCQDNPIPTALT